MVVDTGDLRQPLDVAHAEPAAAQFGDRRGRQRLEHHLDFAKQVDGRAGGDRVDVGRLGRRHHGVGRHDLGGPWRFAAHHLPDEPRQDHGVVVHLPQQARRQQPLHRSVGRGAGCRVAGASDRRPVDESLQQFALGQIDARPAVRRSASRPGRWPRASPARDAMAVPTPPRPPPAPRCRPTPAPGAKVVDGGGQLSSRAPRSPNSANSLANGTAAVVGMQHQQRVEHRQPGRKSRSSVAALTDCRDCALAASAAIDPGGGWVRSGRSSSNRMSRSSGSSANQAPSGTPGADFGHCLPA